MAAGFTRQEIAMNAIATRRNASPLTFTVPCSCGHVGRGAHRKACVRHLVRGFIVANDLVPAADNFLAASDVGPELPDDYTVVADVMREGWGRSLRFTLTYGLMRAGMRYQRAKDVACEAVRAGWILPAGGGAWKMWCEA
jgi:hypothetical protein